MRADLEGGLQKATAAASAATRAGVRAAGETTALLGSQVEESARSTEKVVYQALPHDDKVVVKYDPVELTSWRALFRLRGSVFLNRDLWSVVVCAAFLAASVAIPIAVYAHHPETYDTSMIQSVIKVVTIAMAFLLGLFVNNAITRWWDIVKTFETLFGSCKKLILVLVNFDVDATTREHVARRCVLSVEMLRFEKVVPKDEDGAAKPGAWAEKFDDLEAKSHMTKEERRLLESVPEQERSLFTWSLVGKAVKVVRDGGKDRATDYRTIYSAVQDGTATVGRLKSAANFHFPFLYVHMLAWMVHLVNFLTALGSGVSIGLIVARYYRPMPGVKSEDVHLDVSEILKALLFLYIQVFLYQAFFSIGAALSFPIVPVGHGAMYRLPLAEMIEGLRKTLDLMNSLADEKTI